MHTFRGLAPGESAGSTGPSSQAFSVNTWSMPSLLPPRAPFCFSPSPALRRRACTYMSPCGRECRPDGGPSRLTAFQIALASGACAWPFRGFPRPVELPQQETRRGGGSKSQKRRAEGRRHMPARRREEGGGCFVFLNRRRRRAPPLSTPPPPRPPPPFRAFEPAPGPGLLATDWPLALAPHLSVPRFQPAGARRRRRHGGGCITRPGQTSPSAASPSCPASCLAVWLSVCPSGRLPACPPARLEMMDAR